MRSRLFLAVCTAFMLSSCSDTPETVSYAETNGYIVIEVESLEIPEGGDDQWQVNDDLQGFSGPGYLQFKGNGICNGPPSEPELAYPFSLSTGGTYYLGLYCARIWHCVNGGENSCDGVGYPDGETCPEGQTLRKDLSNDAFVSIRTADGTYIAYNGQKEEFFGEPTKLFGGNQDEFAWSGNNSLDQGNEKYAPEWDLEAGSYELLIQGRSQDFRIDKLMLFNTEQYAVKEARDNVNDGLWVETRE